MTKMTYIDTVLLVDCLRKSLLYQTPSPVFLNGNIEKPDHFVVKMKTDHYQEVMRLIQKAGGWTLPESAMQKLIEQFEQRSQKVFVDGEAKKVWDFSETPYAELMVMASETSGIAELKEFHEAIKAKMESLRNEEEAA